MSKLSVEAKVGFFVVIGILLLGYMSMKVGKFSFKRGSGQDISVFFDSASGLSKDVPVEIAGVEVGRVRKISLKNGKALVTLRINPDIKLRKDVKAAMRTRGILGDKYVELIPGSLAAPLIKAGEQIVQAAPVTDMNTLMNILGEVAMNVKKLTKSLANVFAGEKGEASLRSIMDNTNEMVEALNRTVQANNKDFSAIIANFTSFSERLKDIGDANSDDIRDIVANMRAASQRMESLVAGINDITAKINEGKGSIGKLVNDKETIDSLNRSLAALQNITDKINRGEGTIGKLINDEETVDNMNFALAGINDYIKKQDTFRTYFDYRGEYLFDSEETKSYVSLRIQPREDKYYLLQVIDDPRGRETVKDTTRTIDGVTTTEHKVKVDRDELKFSAQIAKRYYDLGLRGGIFESTGGVGIDYYFFKDRLTLSLEAFDFDPDRNAHLKFKADFKPVNHIYISSGFDDFISDEGRESFFIGAGISFADEDIKTFLSDIPIPMN